MVVYSLYILHWPETHLEYLSSDLLIHRSYHYDLPNQIVVLQNFEQAYKNLLPHERTPFIFHRGISYIYIHGHNDIILLAITRRNIDAMLTVVFLNNFYGILVHYICDKAKLQDSSTKTQHTVLELNKDVIMDNSNLICELLDECMDFGIVQNTDYKILKEYIKIEVNLPKLGTNYKGDDSSSSDSDDSTDDRVNLKRKKARAKIKNVKSTHNQAVHTDVIAPDIDHINSSILRTTSLAINWRPKGIFYAKNEIYIDIIENCEFLYSLSTNTIKKNEIYGRCTAKCYLSGMPVCKIGFNEKYISGIDNDDDYLFEGQNEIGDSRQDNILTAAVQELGEDADDDDDMSEDDTISNKIATSNSDQKMNSNDQVAERTNTQKNKRKIPIRNIQFHQCVELASVYKENIINFTPPDDKFILMTYHVEQQKQKRKLPLIMVRPTYRIVKPSNKLQIICILSTNFKKRLHCRNLKMHIPINPQLLVLDHKTNSSEEGMKFKSELGDVSYKVDSSELVWHVDNVNGRCESIKMMAELALEPQSHDNLTLERIEGILNNKYVEADQSDEHDDEMEAKQELDRYYGVNGATSSLLRDIQKELKFATDFNHVKVSFNIPMMSYSGLRLNFLKVTEEQMKYTCFPWVRYITESNSDLARNNNVGDEGLSTRDCNYRFELGIECFKFV